MIVHLKQILGDLLSKSDINPEYLETLSHLLLLVIALASAWFVGYACRKVISPLVRKLVKNTKIMWDDYFFNEPVIRAFCHIIPGLTFYILLPFCLPEEKTLIYTVITQGTKIYITITFITLITAFLNNIENFTINDEKLKDKQLYGTIEFLKIVAYFVGGIIIFSYLIGQSPISMIAGIGAAATVLMLIFKDSLLGLVAGIQLSTNKMLKPGDWITIKDMNIDGVVEQVSLTTVKVRNFDNTISTVPPYYLISNTFQNWAPMKNSHGRRIKRALYIDVNSIHFCNEADISHLIEQGLLKEENTGEMKEKVNLTLFREYAEQYIKQLPYVNKEVLILVRQLDPTPNGLPIEFYYFSTITEFKEYETLTAGCLEHLIASIPYFGLSIYQSPTGNDFTRLKN